MSDQHMADDENQLPDAQSRDAKLLTRREAITRVLGLLGGSTLVGGNALLSACVSGSGRDPIRSFGADPAGPAIGSFSVADVAWLDEVADTILPATQTPGAKAAGVGAFIAVMVTDAYSPEERRDFLAGMRQLEAASNREFGRDFLALSTTERLTLLARLDREQFNAMRRRAAGQGVHYFRMIKELTLLGYFTSEVGYTKAMRYQETPGRFDPCVPYQSGDKSWAPHA